MLKKSDAPRNNPTLLVLENEIQKLEILRERRQFERELKGNLLSPSSKTAPVQKPAPVTAMQIVKPEKHADESKGSEDNSIVVRATAKPAPKKNYELHAAHEIARTGEHALGIAYAGLHVPRHLDYTIEAMCANAALAKGDEANWLRHINNYLRHFGAAPVRLRAESTLLDRFSTDSLPEVTGGPLVSVIMPAWNAQNTIRAAAQSILNQTWRNFELLIIDDASEDNTWGAMQEIAARDNRVKIFRNKINVGPYVSKNIMLSMARGEWVTGQDADDWAHPQRLEHHMAELRKSDAPRASITFMIRLEANGMMDRFAPISDYSLDGIARDAAISCTFRADFLRNTLGSWDNVRFGADSELISRTQALIGDEFVKFPQISMLCMNFEGSLTNNATYGVGRTSGPSQIRRDYSAAWTKWHKTLKEEKAENAQLPFPPSENDVRPFPTPDQASVPLFKIKRNHAALTGQDPACQQPVTAICSSKRPWFTERVANMLKAQTHENLHVIYVAHGPGHDVEAARRSFGGLASATILELPNAETPLGAALNLALDHCKTDFVAKIDDDDFYGPNYIRSSLAALLYSGFDNVGIIGRERAYCYVEELNMLALRYSANHENSVRTRVFGGTIFWSRKLVQDQRFAARNTGEDSTFFRDATEKGINIFSAESEDYIHLRYAAQGSHTWNISSEDFLKMATKISNGLRLDLAYSSKAPIEPVPVPSRSMNTDTTVSFPKLS